MLPMYRRMRRVDDDPTWDDELVDSEVLMLPVYPPAALLDDDLRHHDARHVVVSSASSKTSMGLGLLLQRRGISAVGLSGKDNTPPADGTGVFDTVLSYDDIARLPRDPGTTYVDVAGDPAVTRAVHEHLGPSLVRSLGVGGSHLASVADPLRPDPSRPGPAVVRFSVGQREVDLAREIGPAALGEIEQRARRTLVTWAADHIDTTNLGGLESAGRAWHRIAHGRLGARAALTVTP